MGTWPNFLANFKNVWLKHDKKKVIFCILAKKSDQLAIFKDQKWPLFCIAKNQKSVKNREKLPFFGKNRAFLAIFWQNIFCITIIRSKAHFYF